MSTIGAIGMSDKTQALARGFLPGTRPCEHGPSADPCGRAAGQKPTMHRDPATGGADLTAGHELMYSVATTQPCRKMPRVPAVSLARCAQASQVGRHA